MHQYADSYHRLLDTPPLSPADNDALVKLRVVRVWHLTWAATPEIDTVTTTVLICVPRRSR